MTFDEKVSVAIDCIPNFRGPERDNSPFKYMLSEGKMTRFFNAEGARLINDKMLELGFITMEEYTAMVHSINELVNTAKSRKGELHE